MHQLSKYFKIFCSLSTSDLAVAVLQKSTYLSHIIVLSLPVTLWFHIETSNLYNKRLFLTCFHVGVPFCYPNDIQIQFNSLPTVQMILQDILTQYPSSK